MPASGRSSRPYSTDTAGAAGLLRRRPNPSPTWFGYHEVWHAMVIAASLCHYAAIMLLLTR